MQPERIQIIPVDSKTVLPIRHQSMWPDKPLSFVKVEGDEQALHLALLVDEKIVSVISIFPDNSGWQFRKFATLPEFQNKGYGSKLLQEVLRRASDAGIKRVWCNARTEKSNFYAAFGLRSTGTIFFREAKEYVIMESIRNESQI